MENIERVIAAYKAMDQRRREANLRMMEIDAKRHPDRARLLRLVVNDRNAPKR